MNYGSLKDKVVVITGAGSGMGRSLAHLFAKYGSKLALSDINRTALQETVKHFKTPIFTETFDVADKTAFSKHTDTVLKHYKKVDIVINNAGVGLTGTIAETSHEDLEWIINTNLWGVINGTKFFLPSMLKHRSGTIVNMSSMFGFIALPAQSAYCATKFAVRAFTESLRQEMTIQNTGVDAICVHPGVIRTQIAKNSRFYSDPLGRTDKQAVVDEFEEMAGTTADQASRQIIRGIIKKKPRILIGKEAYFVEWLQRWRPVYYGRTLKFIDSTLRKRA